MATPRSSNFAGDIERGKYAGLGKLPVTRILEKHNN